MHQGSYKTPTRKTDQDKCTFSPVELHRSPASPGQKNLTGIPRLVRDLTADLYNNIQKWNEVHVRGAHIVKQIAILKADKPREYFPELEAFTTDLYECIRSLHPIKKCFEVLKTQIQAIKKLQKNPEPLFASHDVASLERAVHLIADAYIKEFGVKETVLENIAHARNKDEVMFFATSWTLQVYINSTTNMNMEWLLIETGHRTFS